MAGKVWIVVAPKKIPVRLFPVEKEEVSVWLDPDAQVVVMSERLNSSWRKVPDVSGFISDADENDDGLLFTVETFRPYYRRQFRQTTRLQLRWKPGLMQSSYELVGKSDIRCKRCRRVNRYNRLHLEDCGCPTHVKFQRVEAPHPQAGKVFACVSTTRLYGIESDIRIMFQNADGKWALGTVQEYPRWREFERKQDREVRNEQNKRRRHDRQPNRYERLMRGDFEF